MSHALNPDLDDSETRRLVEMLQWQIAHGLDEIILSTPQNRFHAAAPVPDDPDSDVHSNTLTAVTEVPHVDFNACVTDLEVLELLKQRLGTAVTHHAHGSFPLYGPLDAPLLVVTDPPGFDADRTGDFMNSSQMQLLYQSFQCAGFVFEHGGGAQFCTQMAFLPVSPWRMPQDRKPTEIEAQHLRAALERRVALYRPRVLALAGAMGFGLSELVQGERLFDLPVVRLIAPQMMQVQPRLKARHWQALLRLRTLF